MSYQVEKVTENLQLGEGPHWDEDTCSLYIADIVGKSVHKLTPSTKSHSKAVIGEKNVSFIIPVEGQSGKFVIGNGNELSLITWDGRSDKVSSLETLVELKNDAVTNHRWNDGKVDSSGRLWAGVMYPKAEGGFYFQKGSLYSLNADRTLKRQVEDVTLSNGLAWNDEIEKFYYIDTLEGVVYQFDYDAEKCSASNRQVIFTFKKHGVLGLPDGMTIDADGNLWVACFGGNRVIKIDPRRPETLLQTVDIPAKQVTSVAFGGPNLDELYVTTAKIAQMGNPAPEGPEHGVTYKVTGLGVKGLRPYKVKL